MRLRHSLIALLTSVFVFALFPITARTAPEDRPITEQEIRLGYRQRSVLAKPLALQTDPTAVEKAELAAGATLAQSFPALGGIRTLELPAGADVETAIQQLVTSGAYAYVEPDNIVRASFAPNDPSFVRGEQWALKNIGLSNGTVGADIHATDAWDILTATPVIVAVIDSGLRTTHEDIAANVANPLSFSGQPILLQPNDDNGHGTHVAGIIGAVGNNGVGISGVAHSVKIRPYKFLDARGVGSVSGAISAINSAIALKVSVINASYGSVSFSSAEFDALTRARDASIIVVAAAGNDGSEITDLPTYPAAYNLDNIIAVAASTRNDALATTSTYGAGLVELAAPGASILSLGYGTNNSYAVKSGTSMAAPHVTGAIALLAARFPSDSYRQRINRVLNSVDVLPAFSGKVQTGGRLNLARALSSTHNRPFNDDFSRRAVLSGENTRVRSSNIGAGNESGEPVHANVATTASLWWSWTAPADAAVTIDSLGTFFDSVLAVYTGTALNALTPVASNDDDDAPTARVTFQATAGVTYQFALALKRGGEGPVSISLNSRPTYDAFATARAMTGPSFLVRGNNASATPEPGETLIDGKGKGRSLWYRWTAPATRIYQLSAVSYNTDPIIAVYTGNDINALTKISSDDDSGIYTDSFLSFTGVAGTTYSFAVDVASGAGGDFTLSLTDADWQYVTDASITTSPSIGADGTVYGGSYDNYLYALNGGTGARRWRYKTGNTIELGSTVVASDGTLYTGSNDGKLYAHAPDGTLKWGFAPGSNVWAAPALAPDGTIYVKSDSGNLYAVQPDGAEKWRYLAPGATYSSPVVGADGMVYIGASDTHVLVALRPDGTEKWRFDLGGEIRSSPAIGADGTLYLGSVEGVFFAIAPDGSRRWQFDTQSSITGSAALSVEGGVYFGATDGKLYALNATTGALQWSYATAAGIRATTPLVTASGRVFIGSDDAQLHLVDSSGKLVRVYAAGDWIRSSPVIANGKLYFTSLDGKIYAFATSETPSASAWPMHRQNARRTGSQPFLLSITTSPAAQTVTTGARVTLTVAASSSQTLSYQWRKDGVDISGATNPTHTIPVSAISDTGVYTVAVSAGSITTVSSPAALVVQPPPNPGRIINLSVLSSLDAPDASFTLGFVIGGTGTTGAKPLLIRAAGPSLAQFSVGNPLADPKLQFFAGATLSGENDNWGGTAALTGLIAQVGAFPYTTATSKDAAFAPANLTTASNSIVVSGVAGATGTVLAEIYDATPTASNTAATPRLINVSVLKHIPAGATLTAGFVIGGATSKTILIRAIGPTLAGFGVGGPLADPALTLNQSGVATPIATNDNWGGTAELKTAFAAVGAFALEPATKDAVLLVTVSPGSYTAQISGVANTTGVALIEVYEVP